MCRRLFTAICLWGLTGLVVVAAPCSGNYMLLPEAGGLAAVDVEQNTSVTIDLVLSSDGSDTAQAAVFTVQFSAAGLGLDSYTWQGGFDGSGLDGSVPASGALPATIDTATYVAGFGDPNAIDILFDNFTLTPFGTGTLVSLVIAVPGDFPLGVVTVTTVPDMFDDGGAIIATSGGSMTLNIIEGSLVLLPGDANHDGQVDGNDLISVEENFGSTGTVPFDGDANNDGQVDGNDLISVEENFGAVAAASVPEPMSLALLGLPALALALRRRRRIT